MRWRRQMPNDSRDRQAQAEAEYFQDAIDRFGAWLQFGDAKLGAVLVLLGFGLSDLLTSSNTLIHAHSSACGWGTVATIAYWAAIVAAAIAVVFYGWTIYPALRAENPSVYFFGYVAKQFTTAEDYQKHIHALTPEKFAFS